MPITVNDGGVLRTLGAVTSNDGGVIRELSSVHTNDGGVLREVHSAKKVKIEGITPLVEGDDFMVIAQSGTFTLSAPAGTRFIIGGAGSGQKGGHVIERTLAYAVENVSCTATLGGVNSGGATTLKIGSTIYQTNGANVSSNTGAAINTRWGPIGGNGGGGAYSEDSDGYWDSARNGTGAGGGGGGADDSRTSNGGIGGNRYGYGNRGGNGGNAPRYDPTTNGEDGLSGTGGVKASGAGGGGGGGYSAGGGQGGNNYVNSAVYRASAGQAGAGIIVIEW